MIDASDKRLRVWLASLEPRQELVVRMALHARAKNLGPRWDHRVAELMRLCKINSTAKMAKLLTEVRKHGNVVEAWLEANGPANSPKSRQRKRQKSNPR